MAPSRRPETVIGLDVGKSSHWACVASRDGEVLLSAPIANREGELDSLFAEFPGALVVVDQSRNIGALALSRAKAAGMPSAYLWIGYTKLDSFVRAARARRGRWPTQSTQGISPSSSSGR